MLRHLTSVLLVLCLLLTSAVNADNKRLSDRDYYNKVRGAWTGKCIGGALGMPVECWRYTDIDAKYPQITGYIGYFDNAQTGWSGMLQMPKIPKDGDWHHFIITLKVPKFDGTKDFAAPIIGMSLENSTTPAEWELRSLKILRPKSTEQFNAHTWQAVMGCSWSGDVVKFSFDGQRSWLKMIPAAAKNLKLKPGDDLLVSFDAKWTSGDNRIGIALDYRTIEPGKGFGPDDDTSYQIIGLHALETYSPDLTSRQIGKEWLEHVPQIPSFLAEGLAMERMRSGIEPPESGEHPIGEAIGGQMKGEIWGLICPGRPDLAAEYARRDGVVAHCKNGVYGEQFVASMISAAFYEKNVSKLIETGLSSIPKDSKYADVVREVIAWHLKYPDWRDTRRDLIAKYPNVCNPVYAETGIVTLALLYGNGDFEKSICIAASCGSDTDCNCATVGALLGCVYGADAIPKKWKEPIGDSFKCFAKGYEKWNISELSRRICAAGRKTFEYHRAVKPN